MLLEDTTMLYQEIVTVETTMEILIPLEILALCDPKRDYYQLVITSAKGDTIGYEDDVTESHCWDLDCDCAFGSEDDVTDSCCGDLNCEFGFSIQGTYQGRSV